MLPVLTDLIDEHNLGLLALGMAWGAAGAFVASTLARQLRKSEPSPQHESLLDTAINNMSQGLVMFDKDLRLAVCNQRYREMYKMPADICAQRPTLREVLNGHFARGVFQGDADDYVNSIMRDVTSDAPVRRTVTTSDGRIISIVNRQLADGGRIATHEDVSDRHQLAEANARAEALMRKQRLHLDAALNNMMQGVCMFDADARIVLCNRRFLEMYRLSPNVVKPGCSFYDLIRHRIEVGLLKVDADEYCRAILANVAKGEVSSTIVEGTDGRIIDAVRHPLPNGGWVTTHEDITPHRRAEALLREQKLQLDSALDNMSQGLCMFDAQTRLVLCNKRYLQMYGLPSDMVKPGMMLLDLLTVRRAMGTFSREPQDYIAEMVAIVAEGHAFTVVTPLSDGRIINVENHPMVGGGWVSTHDDITERRHAEELLRERKLQLDSALNNMTQGLNMFDALGRLVVCNERYREMYRLPPEAVTPGRTIQELVTARIAAGTFFDIDAQEYSAKLLTALGEGKPTSDTMELADGRVISVISQPTPSDGGWVVTHEDITERRRAEKERDRSQAFATTVIENVPATIIVKDARDLRYVLVNRAGEAYLGLPRHKIIGKSAKDLFPPAIVQRINKSDRELLRSGGVQSFDEHPSETPGGEHRIIATTRMAISDPNGEPQYLLSVIEDRTNRKRAEAQIAHMAHHDLLTGLPNRSAFAASLDTTVEQAAASGEPFAVMSLDIDGFKEINDVFGHTVGDGLLRELSRRMQEAVGGALVARLGGDEFGIIATDGKQPGSAEALANRLQAVAGEEFVIEGHRLRSALSIGIAVFPTDGSDAGAIAANADAALYRAKSEGPRAYRFFEAGMDERLRERRALQQELQSAVERSELSLHYQPQAKIRGGVIGFEALARWRHSTRGLIPPGTFIALAEESGLIIPLGEWILREACREAASWAQPLNIAINLSPVQFRHGDLAALVHSVLLETGLSPSRLELEITEGVLIGDFSRALSILRRLKALGVRIAMDDFGTGYSSLSYLQAFPFDKIKIDQAFISNLESNPQSATIIRAVIGLARGLNLPVIAEGVETTEQLEFLTAENCDEIQGYLIGRPRPIEDYAELTGAPTKKTRLDLAG